MKPNRKNTDGLAMVAVLLVLMALFVMSAPFLGTLRNADQASAEATDRTVLRITLDSAARHAHSALASSHPALDKTPTFDGADELAVRARFPRGFLTTDDPKQPMWDLEAVDVAGRVDLSSASPHVLANLIGAAARLTAACKDTDTVMEVGATEGFLSEGVLFVDQEVVGYSELGPSRFAKLTRGLLVLTTPEGDPAECGPSIATGHEIGAFVLDQRAWALCEWRIAPGKLRPYTSLEELREAREFMLGPALGREAYLALERTTSPHGHVRAGAVWQREVRVLADSAGTPDFGCKLAVDDVRWFNPGTTVRITNGDATEYALVRATEGATLVLQSPLPLRFKGLETVVAPLARAPVNVNTASPEVLRALWTNLKLRGKSARITAGEADQLVELVLVSRPFTGFEDFVRRFVLPAGGLDELPADAAVRPEALEELGKQAGSDKEGVKTLVAIIDPDDARALYKNALNANDNELEFATMPLCFTSRDVYDLALRAVVNAPSGIERARGVRELSELIVPQEELLSVWTRQADFDEAPRLDQAAAGWMSGPIPTSRPDNGYGAVTSLRWPTRARAHLGPHDSQPSVDPLVVEKDTKVYTFAERENDDGWAQLAPHREDAQARKATGAMHFDDESKALEGRNLPDGAVPLDLATLGWTGPAGLMSGMSFSMWVQPQALEEGSRLLDVGGRVDDADRLSLLFEEGNLVLRVLDGAGDHPTSTQKEQAEVRFPLAGEGPGFPLETWSHVQISVDGNRPDQMALWVDGRRAEKTPGLTRLTGALNGESDTIRVESTEGFPEKCVLRIGDELIEAIKDGANTFSALYQATGENAGFGGRIAREQFEGVPEVNQGLYKVVDSHPAGTSVQLYGYSTPLFSNVGVGSSALSSDLELFAAARVDGVVLDGSEKTQSSMEDINIPGATFTIGFGFDGLGEELDGLLLQPTDPGRSIEDTMAAFSPDGGYAAVLGVIWMDGNERAKDSNGTRLGGVEVVRYSGWDGRTLQIAERGPAGLVRPQDHADTKDRGSFIVYYDYPVGVNSDGTWEGHNEELTYQVLVIPISIPARGRSGAGGFDPGLNGSAFVQITHSGGESHLTEWVRYDEIGPQGHFVRSASQALLDANVGARGGEEEVEDLSPPPTSPGGGGGGRFALRAEPEPALRVPARSSMRPPMRGAQQTKQSYWYHAMGESEDEDFVVSRSVNSYFQFRGVLGTYCHAHPAGTGVVPVFRVRRFDVTGGLPGRFDHVMFLSQEPTEPGFPGVVHHAHQPYKYLAYKWRDAGVLNPEPFETPDEESQSGFEWTSTHVALDGALAVPFASVPVGSADNPIDSRLLARIALYPSGELPRFVPNAQLGGDVTSRAGIPSAVVDEALFFTNPFGSVVGMPGQLVLVTNLSESDDAFVVVKDTLRTTLGDWAYKVNVLANLPEHGGMLRIGDEYLCYDSYDTTNFAFTIPEGGRGLLGSEPQPHRAAEAVTFLASMPVGILVGELGPEEADIPLLELPPGFPPMGTVWIDGELVHYTRVEGNVLSMPSGSVEPGEMDRKGPGLFRGRFGTARTDHARGTPVILWPFRYWDAWSDRADAPEMTYLELSLDQPDAYWKRLFWSVDPAAAAGPEIGVLQRTNPETPWDDVPAEDNGLRLYLEGKLDGGGNPIEVQSDRVQWRVFVRYLPGCFDPDAGLQHGWKASPRLSLFGVEYLGPNRTLARVDR